MIFWRKSARFSASKLQGKMGPPPPPLRRRRRHLVPPRHHGAPTGPSPLIAALAARRDLVPRPLPLFGHVYSRSHTMQIFVPGHVQSFPCIIALPLVRKKRDYGRKTRLTAMTRTTGGGRDGRERRRDRGKDVRRNRRAKKRTHAE